MDWKLEVVVVVPVSDVDRAKRFYSDPDVNGWAVQEDAQA
jgi:predicted enzyme related to lactoylglutathione lyase